MALMLDCERVGREMRPSARVIDSHSVKSPAPGAVRGFDAGRKATGRKRHVVVGVRRRAPRVEPSAARRHARRLTSPPDGHPSGQDKKG